MTDEYLWDRSGEPDPEVERLERVMKTLAFAPREAMVLAPRAEAAPQPRARNGGWRFVLGMTLLSAAATMLLIGGWQQLYGQGERRIEVRTIEVPAVTGPAPRGQSEPPREAGATERAPTVDEILLGEPASSPTPTPKPKTGDTPTVDEILLGEPASSPKPKPKPASKPKPKGDRTPTVDDILDPHASAASRREQPDAQEIKLALSEVKANARACGAHYGATSGERVKVRLTVSGQTGKVTAASPQGEHSDTALGRCVADELAQARFTPFDAVSFGLLYAVQMD